MQLLRLFDGGACGLGEFLHIKRPAAILIGGNEVLCSTDKLRFILNFHLWRSDLGWFGLCNEY